MFAPSIGFVILLLLILLSSAVRVLREYERGVIFRLGRLVGSKGPGLILLIPIVDRMVKVSLRVVAMDVPPQDVITKDNVTVKVNAVLYFQVMDAKKAILTGLGATAETPETPAPKQPMTAEAPGTTTNQTRVNPLTMSAADIRGTTREERNKLWEDELAQHGDMGRKSLFTPRRPGRGKGNGS